MVLSVAIGTEFQIDSKIFFLCRLSNARGRPSPIRLERVGRHARVQRKMIIRAGTHVFDGERTNCPADRCRQGELSHHNFWRHLDIQHCVVDDERVVVIAVLVSVRTMGCCGRRGAANVLAATSSSGRRRRIFSPTPAVVGSAGTRRRRLSAG